MHAQEIQQARQRLIKLIHVAKRDIALDDDSYRAILLRIGNKASAADLTVPELEKVLEHMKRSGFKVRSKKNDRPLASDDQSKMIRGLWLALAGMEVVRNSSEAALGAFVKRMTKVDTLQWLSTEQASQVIEHLKEWRERVTKERRVKLAKVMHLARPTSIEAFMAQDAQLCDGVGLVLGCRAGVAELTETAFQTVLRHYAGEGA